MQKDWLATISRDTFTCEVCCEEIPYPGYEKPRAPLGKRASKDYPNQLCAYCSKESKKP